MRAAFRRSLECRCIIFVVVVVGGVAAVAVVDDCVGVAALVVAVPNPPNPLPA